MANNLKQNDTVLVPYNRLPDDVLEGEQGNVKHGAYSVYSTKVVEVRKRSVTVNLPGGKISEPIASSAVHKNIGVCCYCIGDYETETTLLHPLTKSVFQFCKLLLADDYLRLQYMRTTEELKEIWAEEHGTATHVIIIGHGTGDAIKFGHENIKAESLAAIFSVEGSKPVVFVALCCKTGYASFGKPFTTKLNHSDLICPFHSVSGAVASQFCQTLLTYMLLHGESLKVAFRHARDSVASKDSFRLWKNGKLQTCERRSTKTPDTTSTESV